MGDIELLGYNIEEKMPLVGISLWNLIAFAIILVAGLIVVKVACRFVKRSLLMMKIDEILAEFITRIIRLMLYIFVLGFALGALGINLGFALLSIAVVLGFVLGFALGDTLSNIAAGFMISVTKPFKKGDFVTVSGESGSVCAVGISTTEIDTVDNKRVVIPNKLVWSANITNYTMHGTRMVDMAVAVAYSEDLDRVIKTTMDIVTSNPKVLKDPAPQVAVNELADAGVKLVVRPWCKTADYWDVYFGLKKGLKDGFAAAGIKGPLPQMKVHVDK